MVKAIKKSVVFYFQHFCINWWTNFFTLRVIQLVGSLKIQIHPYHLAHKQTYFHILLFSIKVFWPLTSFNVHSKTTLSKFQQYQPQIRTNENEVLCQICDRGPSIYFFFPSTTHHVRAQDFFKILAPVRTTPPQSISRPPIQLQPTLMKYLIKL